MQYVQAFIGMLSVGLILALPPEISTRGPVFAASFGSHMVLQQTSPVLWGFTDSNHPISLTVTPDRAKSSSYTARLATFNATSYTWRVDLPAWTASSTPHTISVAGASSGQTLEDVLFGEVWVCSGQSNMAFLVEMAFGGKDLVQDANNHPDIRWDAPGGES